MANVTFKTEREFLNAVIKAEVSDAITEFAKGRIAALDKKNEQRKVSKSALAHKAENEDFKNAILAALADGKVWVAATLAAKLGVSTQKISALAKQLADNGEIVVSDVKIQGKGKVKGYALPTPSADEVEDEGEGE